MGTTARDCASPGCQREIVTYPGTNHAPLPAGDNLPGQRLGSAASSPRVTRKRAIDRPPCRKDTPAAVAATCRKTTPPPGAATPFAAARGPETAGPVELLDR